MTQALYAHMNNKIKKKKEKKKNILRAKAYLNFLLQALSALFSTQ
jgi:hypothetical protein